jgi:RNA polymerase sigma-70 factor (ECF subfamily)
MPESDRVKDAIARLKPSDREVFTLIVWDELDHRAAARVLGCSPNAVAVRLHRARARLRDELSEIVPNKSIATDDRPSTPKESG